MNLATPFRPAPKQFTRDGYIFAEVWRQANVAIYSQTREGARAPAAWELVKLRVVKAHPKDVDQSPKENYPSSEEWGKRGWTFLTLAEPQDRATRLLATPQNGETPARLNGGG